MAVMLEHSLAGVGCGAREWGVRVYASVREWEKSRDEYGSSSRHRCGVEWPYLSTAFPAVGCCAREWGRVCVRVCVSERKKGEYRQHSEHVLMGLAPAVHVNKPEKGLYAGQ